MVKWKYPDFLRIYAYMRTISKCTLIINWENWDQTINCCPHLMSYAPKSHLTLEFLKIACTANEPHFSQTGAISERVTQKCNASSINLIITESCLSCNPSSAHVHNIGCYLHIWPTLAWRWHSWQWILKFISVYMHVVLWCNAWFMFMFMGEMDGRESKTVLQS